MLLSKTKFLVTGSAGFIGFHLSKLLLEKNFKVIGVDGFTDFYDVNLKRDRTALLKKNKSDGFFLIPPQLPLR